MLKDQLLEEAKKIEFLDEVDQILESVELLSPEVREKFETVYTQALKANAVKLAESHINKIAERADELVESKVAEAKDAVEKQLYEDADKFLNHLGEKWLAENAVAITHNIKADLCESLVTNLKDVFLSHNVVVPEESVNIVEELDEALKEEKEKTAELFNSKLQLESEIKEIKREHAVMEQTRDLTETQKEKVVSLIEGLDYSESFETKLGVIVEMVSKQKEKQSTISESLNTDADKLSVIKESEVPQKENKKPVDDNVAMYLRYL